MLEVVCKSYYKRGNIKPQHKNPIEAGDMGKFNSYFSNACPDKLQEFVWFNLCYYLDRRGREGSTTIKTKSIKNNQGGSKQKDQDYTDVRMYGIPGSSMDPISSLKLMLSKTVVNFTLILKPSFRLRSPRQQSVGTRTSP